MFCPKCGSQAIDGADYCQKCGAKLSVDNTGSDQRTSATPVEVPRKKRRALPIILIAAVVLIVILVILTSGADSEDAGSVDNTPQSSLDYLTYTNEAEGILFRYPSFWEEGNLSESGVYFSDDSMTMIAYLLAPTVGGPKQPILNIRKAPVTQDVINEIFAATLSDIMPEGNMMATEIEDVAIGDLPGRRFTFVTRTNSGSDATYIRYIYFVNSFQYRIEFIGTTESMESEDIKGYIDDVMSSYIVTAPEPDISVEPSTVSPTTPNSTGTGEYARLVDFGDDESWVTLYNDGTFDMQVNLYVGYGTLSGTYEKTDWGFTFHIEERDFSGYEGDSVEEFEMVICDYGIEYRGDAIGTAMSGSVYQWIDTTAVD